MSASAADTLPVPVPMAGPVVRTLALLTGVLVLIGGTIVTFGLALIGVGGVGIAAVIARRRTRRPTRFQSWLAAVAAVAGACALLFVASALLSPSGTFKKMSAESAAASTKPPPPMPAWLRRISPPQQSNPELDARAKRVAESPLFLGYFMILGSGLFCLVAGGFAGSIGWGGLVLLLFGVRGYWGSRLPSAP